MALSVKLPFSSFWRGLFRRSETSLTPNVVAAVAAPVTVAKPPLPAPTSAISTAAAMTNTNHFPPQADEIEIPLAAIVHGLPSELRAKIMSAPAPKAMLRLSTAAIVSQLSSGTVKISFGELRKLAPTLVANSGGEHDSRTVNLPLPEILARLNPACLARRSDKKVSVTDEITGPFAERGRGVTFSAPPPKTASPTAIAKAKTPPTATPAEAPPNFDAPPLPPSEPIAFAPRAVMPPVAIPLEKSRFEMPATNDTTQLSSIKSAGITISLAALAEAWPSDLKQELLQPPFAGASVMLPESLIEAGLKRGRVTATWKQLRLLVAADSVATPNDALELVLPLKLIAPLFLALKKNSPPTQSKVTVKSEIPDLFFGFPQPTTTPVIPGLPPLPKPTASSLETNYFTPGGQSSAMATEAGNPATPNVQTDFTSRQITPKAAVAKALALSGVVGSVVALPDGLRVASEVPADLNADTLAAFLPQIFERVNQSTRELRMGALNNVSFTVGNVPWKIFRVNSVYFAAFGRAGESLPSAQLVQLAAEIDRKNNQ